MSEQTGLLAEVAAAEERARGVEASQRAERREKSRLEAIEKFRKAFGEDPEKLTIGYEPDCETYRERTAIFGRLDYQGVKFALTHDRGGYLTINALLTCPTCSREVVSQASFFGYHDDDPVKDRERNVAELARALREPESDVYRHRCRENVLKPLRFALAEASRKLGTSEYEVLGALRPDNF